MLRFTTIGLAAVTALALAGCDTLTGGPLVRPGTATAIIEIVNVGPTQINALVMSECDAMSYGLNRLSSGEYIPVGGSARFEISAGCWDVGAGSTTAFKEGYKRINVPAGVLFTLEVS